MAGKDIAQRILRTILLAKSGQAGSVFEAQKEAEARLEEIELQERLRKALERRETQSSRRELRRGKRETRREERKETGEARERFGAQFPRRIRRKGIKVGELSRGEIEGIEKRFSRDKKKGPIKSLRDRIGDLVEKGASADLLDRAAGTSDRSELQEIFREARKQIGKGAAEKSAADIARINRSNISTPPGDIDFQRLGELRRTIEAQLRELRNRLESFIMDESEETELAVQREQLLGDLAQINQLLSGDEASRNNGQGITVSQVRQTIEAARAQFPDLTSAELFSHLTKKKGLPESLVRQEISASFGVDGGGS